MTFRYLNRGEAADYLADHGFPCSPKTLAKHACQGGGPRFIKYGLRVLYRREDLLQWASAQCSEKSSTSDPGSPLSPPPSPNAAPPQAQRPRPGPDADGEGEDQ